MCRGREGARGSAGLREVLYVHTNRHALELRRCMSPVRTTGAPVSIEGKAKELLVRSWAGERALI